MSLTSDRVRSFGWVFVLVICLGFTAGLALRVNAVKSQVRNEESRIIGLHREILFLETEFQTRSNQQQLKALNDVEFGYSAPRAEQYIEGERQLAALGQTRRPDAPKPIRVARTVKAAQSTAPAPESFIAMVSPIDGIIGAGEGKSSTADAIKKAAKSDEPANGRTSNSAVPGSQREQLVRIQLNGAAVE